MKRSWLFTLLALLTLAVVSYLVFLVLQPSPLPAGIVYGNGHIEGVEVRIASEVPGRVLEHTLEEGQLVKNGQRLLVIDPQSYRDELSIIEGELTALRTMLEVIDTQIDIWTHHAETAERQVARLRRLTGEQMASEQELDRALDTERQATGELERLRSERQVLAARIDSASSSVRIAETQVMRSEVFAPQEGTVLVRVVETGEVIQAGQPLAILVDLTRLELKVYLPEIDAGRVKQGASARVRVDAYPERLFEARVARIDDYAQFTPRDIHLPEERVRMVYGVVLALDNPDRVLKPGMPADAWILWDEGQVWPERLIVPRG